MLLVVLLSWSIVVAASDFDDGILKYTITSPSNLEVQCDGLTDKHKNDENVSIPSTVNYNNRTYTVVILGSGSGYTDSMGYPTESTAFSENLKTIQLPSSITRLNSYVFSKCTKLTEITLPNGITEIGDASFYR